MTSFLNSIAKRKKTPDQLVMSTKQAMQTLIDNAVGKEEDKITASDTLAKSLIDMKNVLFGTTENPEVDDEKTAELSKAILQEDLMTVLLSNINILGIETRKDLSVIFCNLLKKNIGGFVEHVAGNAALIDLMLQGYMTEAALTCGVMIRDCLRYEALARLLLASEHIWQFFKVYVHLPNFDIASDAFNTLKELLVIPKHRHVATEFMEKNCDKLLEHYDVGLHAEAVL